MGDRLRRFLALCFLIAIGYGIHGLLGYIPKYSDNSVAIASIIYYLTIGATFIAFFTGFPTIKDEEDEYNS